MQCEMEEINEESYESDATSSVNSKRVMQLRQQKQQKQHQLLMNSSTVSPGNSFAFDRYLQASIKSDMSFDEPVFNIKPLR